MLEPSDLQPVVDFLAQHAPFAALTGSHRRELARLASIEYLRRGASLELDNDRLYVVRSGAVRERRADGTLIAHYGEGDSFTASLHRDEHENARVSRPIARWDGLEDSLLYSMPRAPVLELFSGVSALTALFDGRQPHSKQGGEAERTAMVVEPARGDALSSRLGSLLERKLVSIAPERSIRAAAQLMRRERVSCLVVVDLPHTDSGQSPTSRSDMGIVTDRDLRNRVTAEGADVEAPVSSIMSSPVSVASPNSTLLEALMLMLSQRIHHLVVVEGSDAIGVVTLSDWMRVRTQNPLYLLSDLERQESLEGVAAISQRREQVVAHLVEAGVGPREVHAVLTQLGDAITKRLLELAKKQLAAEGLLVPERDWSWVAFGSQARNEQALGSDQDNGLILGPKTTQSSVMFAKLGMLTCDGLAQSGYPLCNGGIMASQHACRKPLAEWERDFRTWVNEPTSEALMRCSIFFDQRTVVGDASVSEQLMQRAVDLCAERTYFLTALAHNSLERRPPLGFFRQLVVEGTGEHEQSLDIKLRGVIPIVDLARLHALRARCIHPDTRVRLQASCDAGLLSSVGHADLREAFDIIQVERLRHHVRCVRAGRQVNNHLRPVELSSLQRLQLRDAFRVVQTLQKHLEVSLAG